jgi:hypothetical protein
MYKISMTKPSFTVRHSTPLNKRSGLFNGLPEKTLRVRAKYDKALESVSFRS